MADADEFADFTPASSSGPADEFAGFSGASGTAPFDETTSDAGSPETASRIAELGTRALGKGVAQVPSTILDLSHPVTSGMRAGAAAAHAVRQKLGLDPEDAVPTSSPAVQSQTKLSDFIDPSKWSDAVDYLADKAGFARPQTPGERIASQAISGLPSAALAPEAPLAAALSSAAGSAGSQAAAEAGAGPLTRTMAGLVSGSIPAAAANSGAFARRLLGGDSAAAAQSRIQTAADNNVTLTAGQATGSPLIQKAEAASGALWGGGPIERAAAQRAASLNGHVSDIVDNLTPTGATVSPTGAGSAILKGIGDEKTPGSAFGRMHADEKAAYDKLDTLVPPTTPIDMSATLAKLDSLAAPTPGAENTTGALASGKIASMRDNLRSDLEASQAPGGAAQKPLYTAGGNPPTLPAGSLPYSAARALRSAVGNNIDWGFAPADPATNGGLKQVWGALSGDLKAGASAVSPEANAAASAANSLYATNTAKREALAPVINSAGGPEGVFQAATGKMKNGATRVSDVMNAIGPDEQNLVRATVLDRLGRAVPSSQDSTGSVFSPDTFLTKWNGMSDEAKDALFGPSGPSSDLRNNLDSFTSTLSTLKQSGALKNPSGTGKLLGHAIGASNAMSDIMIGLFTGHPAALSGLALPVVNNIAARALTNPKVTGWLAQSAKLPVSALPNAVNQLSQMNDPDARNLSNYLTQATGTENRTARAAGGKVDDVETLVNRLMDRWRKAKKATDKSTEPLLKCPDSAIVRALDIAARTI